MEYTLRDLQLCELQILREVRKVCDRHGLKYFLSCGTLLGAVRHQGFIPWDDDIDIQMPYEDYLRFLAVAQDELGEEYFVQNSDTDPMYAFAYTRVRKNGTALIREWERTIRSHHGVWLDVVPMANVRDDVDYRIKNVLLTVCVFLRMDEEVFALNEKWYTEQSNAFIMLLVKFARKLPKNVRYSIRNAILYRIFHAGKGKYICHIWTKLSKRIPAAAFAGSDKKVLFEGEMYPAPYDWDQYLTWTYGDYMTPPPPQERNGGHGDYILDLGKDWTYYCEHAHV